MNQKLNKEISPEPQPNSKPNADNISVSPSIANARVIGGFRPKVVNHGNVFGTGNWYTFYCGNCGNQIANKSEKCDSVTPFVKGCGETVDWP